MLILGCTPKGGGGGTNLAPVGGCLGFLFPISGSAGRTRPLHELRDLHNEKSKRRLNRTNFSI